MGLGNAPAVRRPFNSAGSNPNPMRLDEVKALAKELYKLPPEEWTAAIEKAKLPNLTKGELTALKGALKTEAEQNERYARQSINEMNTHLKNGTYTKEMAQHTLAQLAGGPDADAYRATLSRHYNNTASLAEQKGVGPSKPDGYKNTGHLSQDTYRALDATTDAYKAKVDQQFATLPALQPPAPKAPAAAPAAPAGPDYAAFAKDLYKLPPEKWQAEIQKAGHMNRFALNSIQDEMKKISAKHTGEAVHALGEIRDDAIKIGHGKGNGMTVQDVRDAHVKPLSTEGAGKDQKATVGHFMDGHYATLAKLHRAHDSAVSEVRKEGRVWDGKIDQSFDKMEAALPAGPGPAAPPPSPFEDKKTASYVRPTSPMSLS